MNRCRGMEATVRLFTYLDDVYFFMKDKEGRFVAANSLQLKKMGLGLEGDLIGKRDTDFFPQSMVERYLRDDLEVMETGKPLERKIELVSNPDGSVDWHTTSKVPVLSENGEVIGIMGFMRDIEKSSAVKNSYHQMGEVMAFIDCHYQEAFEIASLAKIAGLSLSQFEKRFRSAFNSTPKRFLIRYRVTRACHDLINTRKTIAQVSLDNGFYDHSHFSREFKRIIGLPPGDYRKRHR
ncbi:MAG: AraC family transcriptional regulator [Verrucomicrobiota bacterium]